MEEAASEGVLQFLESQRQEVEEQLMQHHAVITRLMAQCVARVKKQLHHNGHLNDSRKWSGCLSNQPREGHRRISKAGSFLREVSHLTEEASYTHFGRTPPRAIATEEDGESVAASSDSDSLGAFCTCCAKSTKRGLLGPVLYHKLASPSDRRRSSTQPMTLDDLDHQLAGEKLGWKHWCEQVLQQWVEEVDERGEVDPRNKIQEWLLPIVHSCWFHFVIGFIVFVNVMLLGVEVDNKLTSLMAGESSPSSFMNTVVEVQRMIFYIFVVEIALRILAEQVDFFKGPYWRWNAFEAGIVAANVLDFCKIFSHEMPGIAAVRALRVIRIFRAIRIIRIFRFLQRLRLMVFSMLACFWSFVWALVLLLIVVFVFAIYLQDAALVYFQTHRTDFDPAVEAKINKYWCGIWMSVASLIYSISGGADWSDLAQPFMAMNSIHGILYIIFIMFTTFMMLNVLVGIFVQESADLAYWDRELVLETAVSKQEAMRNILGELFDEINGDDGRITLPQLEAALRVDRIRAYFAHLNIDMKENSRVFFQMLDGNNDGLIERDEFVLGCTRLQGGAKPLELANLVTDCRLISRNMLRMDTKLHDLIDQTTLLHATLHDIGEVTSANGSSKRRLLPCASGPSALAELSACALTPQGSTHPQMMHGSH